MTTQLADDPTKRLLLPGEWERIQRVRAAEKFLLPVGTSWVERDVHDVAAEVHRLWPNLRVASCACGHCLERGHYPHVVLEATRTGQTVPVLGVTRLDSSLIRKLWLMRAEQKPFERMVAANRAVKRAARKKSREVQQERLEVIRDALRSHKFKYTAKSLGMETTG